MLEVLEWSWLQSLDIIAIIESTSALSRRLENEADSKDCMVELVDRIELCDDGVRMTLKIPVPCSRAGVQTSSILSLSRFVPLKMKRRGVETRIIIAAGDERTEGIVGRRECPCLAHELAEREVSSTDPRTVRSRRYDIRAFEQELETCLFIHHRRNLSEHQEIDGAIPKVDDAPWPGFPADLTSLALVLATQCHGTVLIHGKLFESRSFFVDGLMAMGARIVLCDPHRAVVVGPAQPQAATLVSPDIRAGMALIGAALYARGRSVILNAHQVDRGYERIDERLRSLGAEIARASD